MGSEDQTQVIQLGSPRSLNHLAGPGHFSYPYLVDEGLRHKVFHKELELFNRRTRTRIQVFQLLVPN